MEAEELKLPAVRLQVHSPNETRRVQPREGEQAKSTRLEDRCMFQTLSDILTSEQGWAAGWKTAI